MYSVKNPQWTYFFDEYYQDSCVQLSVYIYSKLATSQLQEIELAAAAEKLAKCQETISQLGKQFESMRPQPDIFGSPQSYRIQTNRPDQTRIMGTVAYQLNQTDSSNREVSTLPVTPPSTNSSKLPRHRHTMSGSSLSSTPTPEKYTGATVSFRRMFTSKRNM